MYAKLVISMCYTFTCITFITLHPCDTSVWATSIYMVTLFKHTTVTAGIFTFQAILVINALCKDTKSTIKTNL